MELGDLCEGCDKTNQEISPEFVSPDKVKISIAKLAAKAAEMPPGYRDELLASGAVRGGFVHLPDHQARAILAKYNRPIIPVPIPHSALPAPHLRGLGDLVALVAQPIARAADKLFGTKLQDCPRCDDRRQKLNQTFPFASKSAVK